MSIGGTLQSAAPLIVAGTVTPAAIAAGRWVRSLTGVVGKLAEVTAQLGTITEQLGAQAREIRTVRRDLALHVRECEHGRPRRVRVPEPAAPAE